MKMTGTKFSWRAISRAWQQLLVIGISATALGACGPGLSSLGPFTIGGTLTGLTGTVVLQNNGGDNLSLTANGSFTFVTKAAKDASYLVTVLTQPTGQTCTVSSGAGSATDKVTSVAVDCVTRWVGTKQLGGVGAESFGQSVAVDTRGNVYVAGDTSGWLDGNNLAGSSDTFFTKYNISGVKQYTQQMGVSGADTIGRAVATDTSGNVYMAGYTSGKVDLDPKVGNVDFFVAKYSSSGVKQYTRQLGALGADTVGLSVATDTSGNVYVAGYTSGNLGINLLAGNMDFFVTKYDSNGVWQYTRQLGVSGADTVGYSVTTDSSGNVYVAGYTMGGLDGNTSMGTVGFADFFVTKYDSQGVKQSTWQMGVAGADTTARSVTVDTSGNVYVAGDTTGNLSGLGLNGNTDYFVTKYNSSGVPQFTWQMGVAAATTVGRSVVVDAGGNVYVAGETTGTLYNDTLTGTKDFFLVKYNSSGVIHFLHQMGVAAQDTVGRSAALDASGNVYVAGDTFGGLDGNALTAGTGYFFVTKYDTNGVKQ
jgi:hypothetical protein